MKPEKGVSQGQNCWTTPVGHSYDEVDAVLHCFGLMRLAVFGDAIDVDGIVE